MGEPKLTIGGVFDQHGARQLSGCPMSELIALRITGETKLTIVDRANGRIELVDPETLGLTEGEEGKIVGLSEAYVFAAPDDIVSRHRIRHA